MTLLEEIRSQKPFTKPYEKGRFVLHYYPDSVAQQERDLLIEEREEALRRLEQFFERTLDGPIHLLAYPSADDAHPTWPKPRQKVGKSPANGEASRRGRPLAL